MRLPSFLRALRREPAIYCSAAPLFETGEGTQPVRPGIYRNAEGSTIGFMFAGDRYAVSGDAAPETVVLIPLASWPDTYIFQQSDGDRTTFYGALRIDPKSGIAMFSPEALRPQARKEARTNHATLLVTLGWVFDDKTKVRAALKALLADAPAHSWDAYRDTA